MHQDTCLTSQLFLQFQTAYEQQYQNYTAYVSAKEAEIDAYFTEKQTEFQNWFDNLTDELRVDTTLRTYQNSYIISNEQEVSRIYPLGIRDYEFSDVILAVVDGNVLTENVDFKILKISEHYPDVDNDGYITAADVSAILAAYTNISTGQPSGLTPAQEKASDANLNSLIDADDAALVSDFYSAVATGRYPDASLSSWCEYISQHFHISIIADDYVIIPLGAAFRQGSRITFKVIKSVIGE